MNSYMKKQRMIFLAIIGAAIIVTFAGLAAEAGYLSLIFPPKDKKDNDVPTNYIENVDTSVSENESISDTNLNDQSDENVNRDEGLKTPYPIVDAIIAESGRYLILKLQSLPGLSIYDTQSAKFIHTINLSSENFLYTAGGDVLLIYYPENNLLQTWSLETFEKLKTKPNPVGMAITRMTMGHSNDSRAFIRYSPGTADLDRTSSYILDINSFQAITFTSDTPFTMGHNASYRDFVHQRTNGDMSIISEWATSHSPTGLGVFQLSSDFWTTAYDHTSVGYIAVGDNGLLYTQSGEIYTSQLIKIGEIPDVHLIPGIGGALSLGISNDGTMQVYSPDSTLPIGPIGKFPGLDDEEKYRAMLGKWADTTYVFDRHIVFDPTHGYILLIPPENDRIIQRDFDLAQMMKDAGVDYLIVTSVPNTEATIGETWQYKIETLTNGSNVKYSIEFGPEGMSIDSDGLLYWDVPTENYRTSEKIVILVENENGDSTYHNFELHIVATP